MEMEREKEQEFEWLKAQKIEITVDLLAAAKQQLQFLAAVDKNRWLYDACLFSPSMIWNNASYSEMVEKEASCMKTFVFLVSLGLYGISKTSHHNKSVPRPHMNNDIFLQGAIARYKGFLHIIKRNWEKSINCFFVYQLTTLILSGTHTSCILFLTVKMRVKHLARILAHDDMDSDRSKGKKLDVGFFGTTRHWEETFGRRYWKAGAMYRGSDPSPLTTIPFQSNILSKVV
ncbi:hypothetical protein NC651_033008 [Populus alba x Populus x berolinensis]|nr:hypothetical protein NC651_033008 [Populus alba x Populus x berolinensis]